MGNIGLIVLYVRNESFSIHIDLLSHKNSYREPLVITTAFVP